MRIVLLVSMVVINSVGLSLRGAATPVASLDSDDASAAVSVVSLDPDVRTVVLTVNGKSIYPVPRRLMSELKLVKDIMESDDSSNIEIPIDTLKELIPDIPEKITDWMNALTLFYEDTSEEKKDFYARLQAMSYVDLIEFYQMCNYLNANRIQDYFFGAKENVELKEEKEEEELKGKASSASTKEQASPKFIPLLLEKASALVDLPTALAPFIQKDGSTEGDILWSGNAQKKLLINYLKKNVFKNRAIVPEYTLPLPPITVSVPHSIRDAAWSSQNILATNRSFVSTARSDVLLFSINDHKSTFLQQIPIQFLSPGSKLNSDAFGIKNLKWNPPGTLLAIRRADVVDICEKNGTWQAKYQIPAPLDNVLAIEWSPDGTILAVAQFITNSASSSAPYQIKIDLLQKQSTDKWEPIQTFNLPATEERPRQICIAWNPQSAEKTIAITNGDDTICFFMHEGKRGFIPSQQETFSASIPLYPTRSGRHSLAWSPDGKTLAFLEACIDTRKYRGGLKSGLRRALVFMQKNSSGAYEKNIKTNAITFSSEGELPLLSWNPNGTLIAMNTRENFIVGKTRVIPAYTYLFDTINSVLSPLVDYSRIKLSDGGVRTFHWESDSIVSSVDSLGFVCSVLVAANLDFLNKCSVNQLLILLITQVMRNSPRYKPVMELVSIEQTIHDTETADSYPKPFSQMPLYTPPTKDPRIEKNILVLQNTFGTFPAEVQAGLYDFMPDLIVKPTVTPTTPAVPSAASSSSVSSPATSPSSSSSLSSSLLSSGGLGIKKSLQQLAHDMKLVVQKI